MRVAVVGGTGTLGAVVVQELVRRGHDTRALRLLRVEAELGAATTSVAV